MPVKYNHHGSIKYDVKFRKNPVFDCRHCIVKLYRHH